ncbi:hypothetical protein MGYG_06766 [Nannizzia gypsea CBS 118893]|uniref:Uncharacterized protein n=1 Tax=Arthroderma gypseum (strain ATCC MYA-4604 / CBS 118893) TaxID=535722 RepID=E4V152_ARTGP|nr:hypothetical protein MGYG_06766 [Nannizzia gypsea CBS 118893]EFR03767.1 hypothetical protein MGYG_06766 [Nannizzia gypsea CBS 118893]
MTPRSSSSAWAAKQSTNKRQKATESDTIQYSGSVKETCELTKIKIAPTKNISRSNPRGETAIFRADALDPEPPDILPGRNAEGRAIGKTSESEAWLGTKSDLQYDGSTNTSPPSSKLNMISLEQPARRPGLFKPPLLLLFRGPRQKHHIPERAPLLDHDGKQELGTSGAEVWGVEAQRAGSGKRESGACGENDGCEAERQEKKSPTNERLVTLQRKAKLTISPAADDEVKQAITLFNP